MAFKVGFCCPEKVVAGAWNCDCVQNSASGLAGLHSTYTEQRSRRVARYEQYKFYSAKFLGTVLVSRTSRLILANMSHQQDRSCTPLQSTDIRRHNASVLFVSLAQLSELFAMFSVKTASGLKSTTEIYRKAS